MDITPYFKQVGSYEVTFTVTDDGEPSLTDSEAVDLPPLFVPVLKLVNEPSQFVLRLI